MATRSKLAVILHADVVGSTALVQRDEHTAHERITEGFKRLSGTIAAYQGTTHEIRGDALLAEFESTSDAVCAALSFQGLNRKRLDELPDDIRPECRIGISMGEVVISDGTLTGPDVVLAQRLEQMAGPGQVCISATVRQSLSRRLPLDFQDLGLQEAKGFEPVPAFLVAPIFGQSIPPPTADAETSPSTDSTPKEPAPPKRSWLVAAQAAVIVALAALAFVLWQRGPVEPISESPSPTSPIPPPGPAEAAPSSSAAAVAAYPLPDRPSIAVLPFNNLSNDREQDYFAEGMAEDLITDLSKISGLFVIARNSSFSFKGRSVPVREIARTLGVRYVLEGSVRPTGDDVRVNAQLIDASTGGHMWADRFDGPRHELAALEERVLRQVIDSISISLTPTESERVTSRVSRNPEAHDAFLRARQLLGTKDRIARRKAKSELKRAIELEPSFAEAYALLAELQAGQREQNALKSIELQETAAGYATLAEHYLWVEGAPERAEEALRKGLVLDPNHADSHRLLAAAALYQGRVEEAYREMGRATQLNPIFPAQYRSVLGRIHFAAERYGDAIVELEAVARQHPSWRITLAYLAAAYVQAGDPESAIRFSSRVRASETLRAREPYQDEAIMNRLIAGVKIARGEG